MNFRVKFNSGEWSKSSDNVTDLLRWFTVSKLFHSSTVFYNSFLLLRSLSLYIFVQTGDPFSRNLGLIYLFTSFSVCISLSNFSHWWSLLYDLHFVSFLCIICFSWLRLNVVSIIFFIFLFLLFHTPLYNTSSWSNWF